MSTIALKRVEKRFGDFQAVKPMDLTIHDGEFVVLLGPSGCGKTTTLRMISGLESVTDGDIYLNDRQVTWLHPSKRDIAFVFQFFALYPHMTAGQNVAFPLQAEGASREEVRTRVEEVVRLLRIEHLLETRPSKLSGGDKQRVALARALVRRPAAFLMDEPLGALDAEYRESMRAEIKKLHLDQKATTVYVTHDQVEAMAMGDRIVIMSNAEIQQVGTPAAVYHDPANLFVARFVGSPGMNLVTGRLDGAAIRLPGDNEIALAPATAAFLAEKQGPSGETIVGFRPESARINDEGALQATVYASEHHGAYTMLHVSLNEHDLVHIRSSRVVRYDIGAPVRFDLEPTMIRYFDPRSELALAVESGQ